MLHLGDITKINGADVPAVNVIIGGSPCQDLSIAGKRAGLDGERSGLFMEQLRIIKEMRKSDADRGRKGKDIRPRFMVWENVPGAFSSNKGEDFGVVLQETLKVIHKETPPIPIPKGGWPTSGCLQLSLLGGECSVAWRVFDAQFWGVPQRRRRIALVADFGGLTASEILFERKSVPGDTEEGGQTGQKPTGYAPAGVAGNGEYVEGAGQPPLAGIGCGGSESGGRECIAAGFNGYKSASAGIQYGEDRAPTIEATMPPNTVTAYSFDALASNSMKSANPNSGCRAVDVAKTLDTSNPDPSKNQGGIAIVQPILCMATQQGGAEITENDTAPTPTAAAGMSGNNQPVICIQGNCIDRADTAGCNGAGWCEDVSYTLNTIDRPAVAFGIPLINDQGWQNVSGEEHATVSPTLRAEMHGNIPAVAQRVVGMDGYNAALTGDKSATLGVNCGQTTGRNGLVYSLENHPNDSRVKFSDGNVVQTLSGRMGTGGGNTPMILECYTPGCFSQDAYDKYSENEISATLKHTGGIYGGGAAKH